MNPSELNKEAHKVSYEHSVAVRDIFWLGAQGSNTNHNIDLFDHFEDLFGRDALVDPTMEPLVQALRGQSLEPDQYIEELTELGYYGMIVRLACPVPKNFTKIESTSDSWSWSHSWNHTAEQLFYVEDFSEIPAIMSRYGEWVTQYYLDLHKKKTSA